MRLIKNIRPHWKLLVCIMLFSFLDGLVAKPDDVSNSVKMAIHLSFLLFVAWAFYKMIIRPRIAFAAALGKNEYALKLCRQEIAKFPNDCDLKITAAGIAIRLSRPVEAIEFANAALSLAPRNTLALLSRSIAQGQLNSFDQAFEDCNNAIESCSESKAMQAHLLWARSSIYLQKGDYQKSIDDCNKALELNPKCWIALVGRSSAYCFSKQLTEAMTDLNLADKLTQSKDMKAVILCTRARVDLLLGKLDLAMEEATAAANRIPYLPAFPATLELVLTRKQDFEKALDQLNKAIEIDPLYAEAYWFRHELYEATGHLDQAENDKEIAMKYKYKPYL